MLALIFSLGSIQAIAEEYKTVEQKYGYAIGYNIARNIISKYPGFDKKAFIQAMQDAVDGKAPKVEQKAMMQAIKDFETKKNKSLGAKGAKNKEAGAKFIAAYKTKAGVKALSDGMYYRVIKSGSGKSPGPTSKVQVHYKGTLISGKEFDSSYSRGKPAEFPLNHVIKGWTISVQKMKPGDKWEVVIPSDLAYGSRGTGSSIGPDETLIFEIELLKVL